MTDDGWTKSYRRKWKHPVFRNFRDVAVWAYLTDNAAWKDDTDTRFDGKRITLMRGQIAVSERFLAEGFCCDRQVIRRLFNALEVDKMLTRHQTHGVTIITICNYAQYQSFEEQENPALSGKKPSANPNREEDNNTVVVIPRELIREVGQRVLSMAGADNDPSCRLNASLVEVWLKRGFDPEFDIYPTINRLMAGRGQGPPISSLKFFDNAVAQAFADRTRTIRDAPHANGTRTKPAKPSLDDQYAELDRLCGDGPGPLESFGDAAGGIVIDNPAQRH